jgi:hypothetical protein
VHNQLDHALLYKNGLTKRLSVENAAPDKNSVFWSICPFEIAQNNMELCINTRKHYEIYMGENGVYGDNVKIIAISEIYSAC